MQKWNGLQIGREKRIQAILCPMHTYQLEDFAVTWRDHHRAKSLA